MSNNINFNQNKINILFVEGGTGWGGSSVSLYRSLKYFDRKKISPIVFFYKNGDGPFVNRIRSLDIEIISFKTSTLIKEHNATQILKDNYLRFIKDFLRKTPLKYILKMMLRIFEFINFDIPSSLFIMKIIKQRRIKIVFLNNDLHFHLPAVLAAKLLTVPCICRKAGIGGGKRIRKFLSRFVDTYIATSNAAALDHIQNKFSYKKIVTIYGGVDLEEFKPSDDRLKIRAEFGISQHAKVIGSVSRIDEGKGYSLLMEAASLVLKEYPSCVFLIIGKDINSDRNLHKKLKDQALTLNLGKNVIFTGWRNDVPDVLSVVDIYVQPSVLPEGLPMATLEAQAKSKPTVVTNAGGLAETVIEGITGFIVPVDNAFLLSRAIMRLINDQNLLKKMGLNVRRRIEEEFDIRKNVKEIEKVFIELFQKKT